MGWFNHCDGGVVRELSGVELGMGISELDMLVLGIENLRAGVFLGKEVDENLGDMCRYLDEMGSELRKEKEDREKL